MVRISTRKKSPLQQLWDKLGRQSTWTSVAIAAGVVAANVPAAAVYCGYVAAAAGLAKLVIPEDNTKPPV